MTGTDGLGIERNGIRAAVYHLRNRLGEGSVHIQVIAGNDEQVIPELLGEILLLMHLRVQALHHFYHGIGLLCTLGLVRDFLELLHHLEHVSPVLRHLQFLHFRIVIKLNRIF